MSVIKPHIDDLLEKTDNNRFLLASLASKRACDINDMLRGQHERVLKVQDVISMAMEEIVDGDISFDHEKFSCALGHQPTAYESAGSVD